MGKQTKKHPRDQKGPEVPMMPGTAGLTGSQVNHPAYLEEYRMLDNDLARDNLENDIPAADLEDDL